MITINTKNAPAAIGPYSQAKLVGNLLFISGQLPINPLTLEIPSTLEEQTHQVCQNIKNILLEAGTDFLNVIKTTCLLTDMNDFADFNKVYQEYFLSKPARSCFAVKELPKKALVEIECIAEINI